MSVKVVCFVIWLPVIVIALRRGDPCITLNKELAKCLPVSECNVIKAAVLTRDIEAIDFARKSQCGIDSQPLVCCGTLSKKDNTIGASCTTPNGEPATCIPLTECKIIADAVLTRNKDAVEFAKQSQCKSLSKVCCGSDAYPIRTNLLPNRGACGQEKGGIRIWGGTITELWEFPWMALLGYRNTDGSDAGFRCGGSLISQRYILTAAHCVRVNIYLGIELDFVRLGEWNTATIYDCEKDLANPECADPVVDLKIEEKIVHSMYNSRGGKNDIALLRLERNVRFSDYIQPICLPVRQAPVPEPGIHMVVVGWGATENSSNSDIKLRVKVPIIATDVCISKLPERAMIAAEQICAGGESGKDSCRGDSGGPLMNEFSKSLDAKPRWYQEGVVSWGGRCGTTGFPAIYTRVANYMDWIVENLKLF